MLSVPKALLLDFGGVIVDGPTSSTWLTDISGVVAGLLADGGISPTLSVPTIVEALLAAEREVEASQLNEKPLQQGSEEFWAAIVGRAWPDGAQRIVRAEATRLTRCMAELKFARTWKARPGIADLLGAAAAWGLRMAIVSNAISGAVHREFLFDSGLVRYFDAQLYSDEQGVRKPGPELIWQAADIVGVRTSDCWFVGDTRSRDILAARRAGCGTAVLMESVRVEQPPYPESVRPDAIVADPDELRRVLAGVFAAAQS